MPSWARAALEAWLAAAPAAGEDAPIFRAVNRGGRVADTALSAQAVHKGIIEACREQ